MIAVLQTLFSRGGAIFQGFRCATPLAGMLPGLWSCILDITKMERFGRSAFRRGRGSQEPGVRSQETGVRSQESGDRSRKPEWVGWHGDCTGGSYSWADFPDGLNESIRILFRIVGLEAQSEEESIPVAGDRYFDMVSMEKGILEGFRILAVDRYGRHLDKIAVGTYGRQSGKRANSILGLYSQPVTRMPPPVPLMAMLKANGCRNRQEGGDVPGSLPLMTPLEKGGPGIGIETGMSFHTAAITPADNQGIDPFLPSGIGVEKGGSLGSTEPLMTIADIEVGPQCLQVQWDLAGGMGAVDDRTNTGCPGAVADILNGK